MKAKEHLFCPDCGLRIYKQGEEMRHITPFIGTEERCSNCDKTLRRRSPGGQSDTWNFTTVSKEQISLKNQESGQDEETT